MYGLVSILMKQSAKKCNKPQKINCGSLVAIIPAFKNRYANEIHKRLRLYCNDSRRRLFFMKGLLIISETLERVCNLFAKCLKKGQMDYFITLVICFLLS